MPKSLDEVKEMNDKIVLKNSENFKLYEVQNNEYKSQLEKFNETKMNNQVILDKLKAKIKESHPNQDEFQQEYNKQSDLMWDNNQLQRSEPMTASKPDEFEPA